MAAAFRMTDPEGRNACEVNAGDRIFLKSMGWLDADKDTKSESHDEPATEEPARPAVKRTPKRSTKGE